MDVTDDTTLADVVEALTRLAAEAANTHPSPAWDHQHWHLNRLLNMWELLATQPQPVECETPEGV